MSLNRWSTLASFHRTMILRVCRPSFPVAAGGASIDAGVGVCGSLWACCSPRARLLIKAWLSGRRHLLVV